MQLLPDIRLQKKLIQWSIYLAWVIIAVAIFVLIGWEFDITWLRRPIPHLVAMNPLTASCFLLAGISFLMIASPGQSRSKRLFINALAGIIFCAVVVKLLGLINGFNWQIDQLLFSGKLKKDIVGNVSNSMAPNTAFSFLLVSTSLILLQSNSYHKRKYTQYFALVIALTGWLSILGYIYQVKAFYGLLEYIPMAFHTAICFLCIALSFLFFQPGYGIMQQLTSATSGSLTARVLVPAAVLVPTSIGILRLQGDWSGIYSTEFGVVLYTISIITIFLALAWYIAITLNKRDVLRKATEDALRKSEEEIVAIFKAAPDAVIVIDESSRVIKWNKEAELLFGFTSKEITGKTLTETVIPPEYRESHIKGMQRYIETGESRIIGKTVELKALKKNNIEFDVSLRIASVSIENANLFVGFARDITEQKATARKLRSFNEELARQVKEKTRELTEIFERLSDGFISLDKNFCFTYMNKKAGEITHRIPESMIGKNVWEVFPDAVGSGTYNAFLKAMNDQRYVSNTDYYEPLDLWQENHIYPSPEGLSVFIRDITSKKRAEIAISEARMLADKLIDSLPGVFYFYDENGKFIRWNSQFEKVTGYSGDEIAKMHPIDFFFEEDREYITGRIRGVFEKGENDAETNFVHKNGKGIPYYFKAVLIQYEGKPCLLGYGVDITERKNAEIEMQRLNTELRKLTGYLQKVREDERTHIAREIHDELGQQLTVLKMDISWINKKLETDDPTMKEKLTGLLSMIDTTVKTVRRIASELRPSLLDDLGLIPAMEWHLEEFEKRSGIHTIFKEKNNGAFLTDDIKIGLFRIFQESLTNVARHSNANEVSVSFEENQKEVILTISDNGIGFEAENAAKKTLGILGMKERIAMLGGKYIINGATGKGTTVLVSVPLGPTNN